MRDTGVPGLTRSDQMHAVTASYLGWMLDAFDYFVVVFLIDTLATAFNVTKKDIAYSLFLTLLMRPVGAVIFGLLADRYGRRRPLMANIVYFSLIEVLCGFSPNFTFFLVMRALYGIGMGGEWGVGASLAMESVPVKWRGIFSGILQSGYSMGYLVAALVARFVLPSVGWRWMFWIGGMPVFLAFYIASKVPESEAWKQHRAPSMGMVLRSVTENWRLFAYLIVLMTFMMFLSHGTQDLYPDFLGSVHHATVAVRSYVAIVYNVGAIVGAIIFGMYSERAGRRRSMIAALLLSLVVIPFWAFGGSLLFLACAAFVMQAGVQGAWGIIPVHLTEMAPDETRGLVPGLAYQLGILIAAPTANLQLALNDHFGYQWTLAGFELVTILVLIVMLAFGKERRGRSFFKNAPAEEPLLVAPRV
jgi:SHS family lactate transporter-like MFS transporter